MPVCGRARRIGPRSGSVAEMTNAPSWRPAGRVDPRQEHPAEDEQPRPRGRRAGGSWRRRRPRPSLPATSGAPTASVPVATVRGGARRTAPGRPGRSSRPPRPRPRSRRSSPSTAPAPSAGPPRAPRSRSDRLAQARRRSGARPPARSTSRPTVIRPRTSSRVEAGETRRARRRAPSGSKPALAGSPSTLTWSRTGHAAARPDLGGEAVQPLGQLDRVDRLDRPRTSRARACALFDWSGPTRCHVAPGDRARPWPRPPGRGSRRGRRQARRDGGARAARRGRSSRRRRA